VEKPQEKGKGVWASGEANCGKVICGGINERLGLFQWDMVVQVNLVLTSASVLMAVLFLV
jgi:hypothetical protein